MIYDSIIEYDVQARSVTDGCMYYRSYGMFLMLR